MNAESTKSKITDLSDMQPPNTSFGQSYSKMAQQELWFSREKNKSIKLAA